MSDFEDKAKVSKGVRLGNKKSSIFQANEAAKQSEEEFKQKAQQLISEQHDINKRMFELSKLIITQILDTTLSENKSPAQTESERDSRIEITKLALQIDNDESVEQLNVGTMANIQVIYKSLFSLRDRLNDTMFENFILKKRIDSIEAKIKEIEDKANNV